MNVLGCGRAVGIRTGQYLNLPFTGDEGGDAATAHIASNASFADAMVSMQKALGVPSDHFSGEKFCSGGIPGLYKGA